MWEDSYGCAKQCRYDIDIYLMTVILSFYGVIMYGEINTNGNGKYVFDCLNATDKCYLK